MRIKLRDARKSKKLKQRDVANYLNLNLRQYQRIESGESRGKIETWDALEDLFEIPQRQLREDVETPRN